MSLIKVATKLSDKNKPTRAFSKKQENYVAKELNGQRQKNSGATLWAKGDVVLDNWLLECKTKTSPSQSMTIHKEWLEKNAREALFIGKPYNALVFNFGPNEENHYIIDEELFKELVEYLKNKGNN